VGGSLVSDGERVIPMVPDTEEMIRKGCIAAGAHGASSHYFRQTMSTMSMSGREHQLWATTNVHLLDLGSGEWHYTTEDDDS